MDRLRDRVAVITGASSGIGQAVALAYAREGARVVVSSDKNVTGLEATASEVRASGGQALVVQADVGSPMDMDRLVEAAVDEFGRVDILFANAGFAPRGTFLDASTEDWNLTLTVNLRGIFLAGQRAARQMVKQGTGGVIVNCASQAAETYVRGLAPHYQASKAGVVQLTKVMAVELGPQNIRVNAIAPSLVVTERLRDRWEQNTELREYHLSKSVFGRACTLEDIQGPAIFLASDEARFINGHTLYVDGGFTIQ